MELKLGNISQYLRAIVLAVVNGDILLLCDDVDSHTHIVFPIIHRSNNPSMFKK